MEDVLSMLNCVVKNEVLLKNKVKEYLEENQIERKEELYELIREVFSVPLKPLKVMELMGAFGRLKVTDRDVLLLCEALPDSI